ITPADLGIFPLRARPDLRVLDRQPILHCRIITLIGSPRGLLRRVTPARYILANTPNRQPNIELTPDQLANRSSCPQGKWQRQLVRELATNQLLSPALFLRRQRTQTALRASTARHALQQRRGCRQALEHRRYVGARV